MPKRTQLLIITVILLAASALAWAVHFPNGSWIRFSVFLTVILLSSGLKVVLPQGEGSMSLNFPFILLAVVELSPMQAMLLAAISVAAQCRLRVKKLFTAVQIVFNVASSISATAAASVTYQSLAKWKMAPAPALSLASVSYFLASTVPVAMAIATSKNERPSVLWRTEFPWYLPFYFVGAILAALADGVGIRFGPSTSLLLIPVVYTIYRAYTAQIVRARERQQHLEETEALHVRTIEALAMAIEAKDQETHEHLFRVRNYVTEVGKRLRLSKLEMTALHTAAFLHDIGKLAVPEHIINKPGKLTLQEFETMKIHPVVGADILDRVRFPYPVVPIVRSHHEWWNGQGYPDGLKGEEIPVGARILTVVDCFDALTSDRPYRRGKSTIDAMAIVKSLSGTQFDPTIVQVFNELCLTMEATLAQAEERVFVPLNLEIDVHRGAAPGAGFEEQNGSSIKNSHDQASSGLPLEAARDQNSQLYCIGSASQEAQSLFEMSSYPGHSLGLQEVLSILTVRLRRLVAFDCCALYLIEGAGAVLSYIHGEQERSFSAEPVSIGDGISGWVAQSGKPILNGNALVEPSYHVPPGQEDFLRAALSVPLFDSEQQVLGVLTLYAMTLDAFSRGDLRTLQAMEPKLSLSISNALAASLSEVKTDIDGLTSLPNRRQLLIDLDREMSRCVRTNSSLAIVTCNISSLTSVRERVGRLRSDDLVSQIATSFRSACRSYDTVARAGIDEFVFVLPGCVESDLSNRLTGISQVLEAMPELKKESIDVSATYGTCLFPAEEQTAEGLLALAERKQSLHRTKAVDNLRDKPQDASMANAQ